MAFKVVLPSSAASGKVGINYTSTYPCLSEENDFIPVKCLMDGEILTSKKTGKQSFLYQLNVPLKQNFTTGKFASFNQNLLSGNNWMKIKHVNLINRTYFGSAGIVVYICEDPYEVIPLMVMCVRTSKLFSLSKDESDLSKFCLLVDNSFINDEHHHKLFRNVKTYINETANEVDVLYTNNLKGLCLHSAEVKMPKFATITEVLQYSKSVNAELVENL